MFREADKNKAIVYSAIVFLAAYTILAVTIMRPIDAYDTFWHLQMGKDLLEYGLSPWVDHYSIRYLGEDIYPVPVMFQTLLYQFVSLFGEQQGFYYIRLFYITLMMLVLWVYFRKIKANAYIIFIFLPLIVSAISLRIIIRPELFSFVLVVACLILYLNAQRTFAIKQILFISLLLLFWTSYHSPLIGYIIIFGLFLEKAINKLIHKDESFSWYQWLLWGVLVFCIGFTNLNFNGASIVGEHFVIGMIKTVTDGFGQYISEYNNAYLTHSTNVLTHVSWILSIYAAVWSLIKKQYGFAFIIVFLTVMSWSTVRLLAVVLIINMCVLSLYWAQFINSSHYLSLRTPVKNSLFLVSVCISLMAFYFLIDKAQESIALDENRQAVLEKRYPVQPTDYLKNYQDGGNILNVLQYGGYLINKLSPDYKVYFDGRSNILYPVEFVKHNGEIWKSEEKVDEVVSQYGIDYVLFENSPERYFLLKKTKDLELFFADDNFMLFGKKGEAEFPLASTLLVFPECWSNSFYQDKLSQGINGEIERSEKLLTDKQYTIKTVLDLIKLYLAAKDKEEFFRVLRFEKKHTDAVRRIAFYLAMQDADKGIVSNQFKLIGLKNHYDILLYSYYLAKNGEYENAEKLAYYFYSMDKVGEVWVTYDKLGVLGRILLMLKEQDKLQQFDHSYVDELEANLNKINYPFDRELSFNFMCK